ncbi:EI24 domain-containing protein [Flammeovirga sp. EKP202]|uniref:EI24 domain-containing protein n=1 Tax=Flammeovirga sp. EKP202 TaxID=2770592 RepID=UPI00165EFA2B|nr:EI24 domain-containing protein [Flammeovirga sp. EKP202]MBD0404021.1 EI24 domain-containing protein [Flammeovirga sp. EKP202]
MKKHSSFRIYKTGFQQYLNAFSFIKKNNLMSFFWFIGIFGLMLSVVLLGGGLYVSHQIMEWVQTTESFHSVVNSIPFVDTQSSENSLYWVLFIFVEIPVLITSLLLFGPLMNLLSFPILDRLTEKINLLLFDKDAGSNFDLGRLFKMAWSITLPNALKSIFFTLLLLPFTFIPFVGPIFLFISLVINSYYSGFDIVDNFFENWDIKVKDSKRYITNHKSLSISIGFGGSLLSLVPIIGGIFSPIISLTAGGLILKELDVYEDVHTV